MISALDTRKQWIKFGVLAASILAIVVVAGFYLKGSGMDGLKKALGTKKMSEAMRDSMIQTDGVIDIQHWVHDSGARIYFVNAPQLPMVDVDITFDAGSARDTEKAGVAFLTNALLSEGTAELDADALAEKLDSLGAQLSNQTQRDMSSIHVRSLVDVDILPHVVETVGALISQPAFPEQGFKREQQTALKLLDHEAQSPSQIAQKAFYAAMYQDQPYATWPHGTKESIVQITPEDLKAFHEKYYVAKNAVITIVGQIDLDGANAIATTITKGLKAGEKAAPFAKVKLLEKAGSQTIPYPSEQTHIMMGAPMLTRFDPDYFSLYVGNHILGGGGMVTRLFDSVREKKGLAYSVHSSFRPMRAEGPFTVGLQTKKESADEALKIMKETVKTFIEQGPTEQELADAKLNILGGFPLKFDSNRAIASHVTVLGFYELPIEYFDKFKQSVEDVTLVSIKDAFQRRVSLDKMVTVMVGDS